MARKKVGRRRHAGWKYVLLTALYAVGLLLLIAAAVRYRVTSAFLSRAQAAEGNIVSSPILSAAGSSSDNKSTPVVQFRTADGSEFRFQVKGGTASRLRDPGQKVQVLYDPGDPTDARLDSGWGLWLGSVGLGALGLCWVTLPGLLLTWRRSRRSRRRPPRPTPPRGAD